MSPHGPPCLCVSQQCGLSAAGGSVFGLFLASSKVAAHTLCVEATAAYFRLSVLTAAAASWVATEEAGLGALHSVVTACSKIVSRAVGVLRSHVWGAGWVGCSCKQQSFMINLCCVSGLTLGRLCV